MGCITAQRRGRLQHARIFTFPAGLIEDRRHLLLGVRIIATNEHRGLY